MRLSLSGHAWIRCFTLGGLLCVSNAFADSLPELSIGSTQSPSELSTLIEQRLQQAYQQLGYQPVFFHLPSERRLRLVRSQELDADLFRLCTLQDEYPDILMIPVPLGDFTLKAYALSTTPLENWQSNPSLIVVHIRGFKMAEQTHFAGRRLEVASLEQAFGLLQQGRADILLEDEPSAVNYLAGSTDWAEGSWHAAALNRLAVCHILGTHLQHLAEPLHQLLSQPNP
ncbi:hypothetical protein [Alkalimonas amylolytica]|uniref:ABC-type amino acid transport substrate-binding protein n=1 Tax=Alkalimonas amylolytica TaxID=152573 RepID=A0A1H4EAX5_ALKAM|nr:hypothetical protein [Alkalimonas amylolytica]SEA81959.1 hypothetical protein SAMN04488051_106312 [Alkalimonas amylolytica]